MRELSLINCRLDRRYDIREQLGRGSYAEIFVARDILASPQSPHSQVVIKALNVFLQDDLDTHLERTLVENFQNEAVALDRVRHPNIISRIGHGTARDLQGTVFHYLVLEYMPGGDLQSRVRRERIPLGQAFSLIEQVCAGLGHAHSRGIIHRDIKPQNLLLSADGMVVKIADFGVARFSLAESPITRVGTNIYAPPEHSPLAAGQTGALGCDGLTPAADIYSLAKTIYTVITGESPRGFSGERITALPDSVRDSEWGDELLRVIRRATDPLPGERHQSVAEFWADLVSVRDIAAEGEYETRVRPRVPAVPQPNVARGYTPIAPAMAEFAEAKAQTAAAQYVRYPAPERRPSVTRVPVEREATPPQQPAGPGPERGRAIRRLATFLVFAGMFTGLLYGTASYMRGRGVLPEIRNPFSTPDAVATTDVYLRPAPSTDNDPIGLVTKNSKVRIVNSQNNWYQVDVVEQGRVRNNGPNATRGWLNGKYLDLNRN
jgi:serine/threonine protein kinase